MTATDMVFALLMFCLGAASGLGAGLFWGVMAQRKKPSPKQPELRTTPEPPDRESIRLARQYENIMNYDGTERGQLSLEK